MGGCSAMNCKNRSPAFAMYVFPSESQKTRRQLWILNTRRKDFNPGRGAVLCEIDFEDNQFELNRADGRKKLKPNAVPTLFDVPNPPKRHEALPRNSVYKVVQKSKERMKSIFTPNSLQSESDYSTSHSSSTANTSLPNNCSSLKESLTRISDDLGRENEALKQYLAAETKVFIETLQNANKKLEEELKQRKSLLEKFLNEDQITMLNTLASDPTKKNPVREWHSNCIIKALKYRFALGVHGYDYLRNSGYPLPSYRTLCRRLEKLEINFGIFQDLKTPLLAKLVDLDDLCILSIDEMAISDALSIDKNKMKFGVNITLGSLAASSVPCAEGEPSNVLEDHKESRGSHALVALLRGVRNPWKQVIGCHITGSSVSGPNMKDFV